MEYRMEFPDGARPSLLGYGCMRLPTVDGQAGRIDEAAATALLDEALARGVTYFDTAYPYPDKQSEPFLAKALAGRHPRDSFLLASKLPVWLPKSAQEADELFESQLKRCGVEYFDFYLAHNLNVEHYAQFESYGGFEVLLRKKAEGKIRRLGFSFHDQPKVLEGILADHPWDFVQIQLNYLDWDFQDAKGQYELITGRGLPVVVMEPVRGGALATLTDEARAVLSAAAPERSAAAWAIRFAASLPGVMTVLSGMNTPQQLSDNLSSVSPFVPLSDGERAVLDKALAAYLSAGAVPCTACRYCMECPAGVNIPQTFALYNLYKADGNVTHFQRYYERLGEAHQPTRCVSCKACLSKCPQHIDIPARLAQVAEDYAGVQEA